MNFDKFKEFFSQLFTSLTTEDSAIVLTFLIISFLLGTIFSWLARGGKIKRLKKALKEKESAYKLVSAEMVGLREQFELKEADLKKAQLEAEDFQGKLTSYKTQNEQMQQQLHQHKEQVEQLNLNHQNHSSTIEDLNNQILGLKSINSKMELKLEETIQERQQAETQKQLLEQQAAISDPVEVQTKYDETIQRLSLLEQKLSLLEAENDQLKTDLSSVNQQSEPSKVSNDMEEVKTLLRKLSQENSSLKSEIYSIKDDSRTKVVRMAEDEMQDVLNRLKQLEQENKNLQTQLGDLNIADEIDVADIPAMVIDEEIDEEEIEDIEEDIDIREEESSEERSNRARKVIQDALGSRIKRASEEEKDDLQFINGIGPFIEEKLNDIGIYTFEQISQLDKELIENITEAIEFFPGRIERDDWVGQAKKYFKRN